MVPDTVALLKCQLCGSDELHTGIARGDMARFRESDDATAYPVRGIYVERTRAGRRVLAKLKMGANWVTVPVRLLERVE